MEPNWTTHEDPQGFALEIPEGWRASGEAGGSVNVVGTDSERVTILPVKIEAQVDANMAWYVLINLSRQFWPQQKWDIPKRGWQFSPNGVRTVGSDESALRQTNALWWVNTREGGTGFFYGVAAPPARFQSLEPVFTRIMESFRVTQAEGSANADPLAGMQFQQWVDPTEMAFSLEVPVGWNVRGGIARPSFTATSEFIIQSPDGQVLVRSGDVNEVSKFAEPNMTMMSLGNWPGMMTSDGTLIQSYQTGLDFADAYVKKMYGRNAQNLQLLKSTDRQDHVQATAWYAQMLGWVRNTAGEVTYSARFGNQPCVIYQFAETAVTHFSDVAVLWNLQKLMGFVAPADRASLADAVLQHAILTFQVNPQWMQRQAQINAKVAEDNRRYREWSNQLWQQTQAERWASWDRTAERRGDVLRDLTRVVDPESGQAYKVQSGSSYYWIDPVRNVIAGTDIPSQPTWDFRAMIQTYD